MNRIRVYVAALSMVALASGVAFAQEPRAGGAGGPGRGRGVDGALPLRQLQLTDAQQDQIRQIRSRHESEIREAASRLGAARRAQRSAVETIPSDESKITAVTQDLVHAEVEVALVASRVNNEIWSVLTSEQQAKLKELRAERRSRLEERRESRQERRRQ